MKEIVARSGKTTSEFYGLLLFVVVVLLNGTDVVDIPTEQVTFIAGLVGLHAGERAWLKNTIAKQPTE